MQLSSFHNNYHTMSTLNWKNVAHGYTGCVRDAAETSLKDSDMAARRLLGGMGLRASALDVLEIADFGDVCRGESSWSRAVRIFQSRYTASRIRLMYVDSPRHLMSHPTCVVGRDYLGVVHVTRVGSDIVCAYLKDVTTVTELAPPFEVVRAVTIDGQGYWLIRQLLQNYIARLVEI